MSAVGVTIFSGRAAARPPAATLWADPGSHWVWGRFQFTNSRYGHIVLNLISISGGNRCPSVECRAVRGARDDAARGGNVDVFPVERRTRHRATSLVSESHAKIPKPASRRGGAAARGHLTTTTSNAWRNANIHPTPISLLHRSAILALRLSEPILSSSESLSSRAGILPSRPSSSSSAGSSSSSSSSSSSCPGAPVAPHEGQACPVSPSAPFSRSNVASHSRQRSFSASLALALSSPGSASGSAPPPVSGSSSVVCPVPSAVELLVGFAHNRAW